jgi:LCP family protein required for cell wall assembly
LPVNEDDLRAAFARHEAEAPDVEELHATINREAARRRKRRGRVLSGGVAAAVALAVGLPVYLTGATNPVSQNTVASSPSPAIRKDVNLLLLGSDHRGSWAKGAARSDTIMIMHIPADRSKIYLISVERDVIVPIPGRGKDKINSAFSDGVQQKGNATDGLKAVEQVLTGLSGITFDGGAVVEYGAFRAITDALGGVTVCLPKSVYLDLNGSDKASAKRLPAGCHKLSGSDALALLRQREGQSLPNGSYDRDRNAQRFLIGATQAAVDLKLPQDAAKVVELTRISGLTIDLPGISAPDLAAQLAHIKGNDVIGLSLSTTFTPPPAGQVTGESIPATGLALLKAVNDGTLDAFIVSHPELVLAR